MSTMPEAGAAQESSFAQIDEQIKKAKSLFDTLPNDGKVACAISQSLLDATRCLSAGFAKTSSIEDNEFKTDMEVYFMKALGDVQAMFLATIEQMKKNL